jgi:hypothetical protein
MFTIIDHENRKCIIFIIDEILKDCWREERVSTFICKSNLWYFIHGLVSCIASCKEEAEGSWNL